MRVIEERSVEALNAEGVVGTEKKLSKRDSVRYESNNTAVYTLYQSDIAIITEDEITLGTMYGNHKTNTTKSRINAISRHFGVQGVGQKNLAWTWDDGEPYTGRRSFPRRP
jgi:hypothetical protein